jgi:hypothetical protein
MATDKRHPEILCPACDWKPTAVDRWQCIPSCGTVWHTFWTGGLCPGCAHLWTQTQCLSCGVVSPHKSWYRQAIDEAVSSSVSQATPLAAKRKRSVRKPTRPRAPAKV